MENTRENKARFFAQYYGQKVMYVGGVGLVTVGTGGWNMKHPDFFLKLKPLSSISDEDLKALDCSRQEWEDLYYGDPNADLTAQSFDVLRGRGFVLPFCGLSVEKMTEFGWIKLTSLKSE